MSIGGAVFHARTLIHPGRRGGLPCNNQDEQLEDVRTRIPAVPSNDHAGEEAGMMVVPGRAVSQVSGKTDGPLPRTRGQVEAEISKAMIRFEREQLGRGPADIRTQIVQDMVIVRMADMLTPSERALVRAGSVDLLKQVRMKLLENEREALNQMLRVATGCETISVYSDLSPETGERIIVFVLRQSPLVR
jgi:uncharacterized protein YbcI